MQRSTRWIVVALVAGSRSRPARSRPPSRTRPATPPSSSRRSRAARPQAGDPDRGGGRAARRQDRQGPRGPAEAGATQKVIPYAAVLYDADGKTWVYANPGPRTFLRAPITVDRIDGDDAFLSDGPPSGTAVVTVGAEELYGTEFGFKKTDRPRRLTDRGTRRHDALDRRDEPQVPLHRGRARRGDDGLWRRPAAAHAGGRLPRVRAAAGGDPDRASGCPRPRWRAWSPCRWSRRSTASPGSTSCAPSRSRSCRRSS